MMHPSRASLSLMIALALAALSITTEASRGLLRANQKGFMSSEEEPQEAAEATLTEEVQSALSPHADDHAKADFTRRCRVSATVGSADVLPVDAVDDFCAGTDAVAECRLKLSKRLREAHGQESGIEGFCDAAYEWFQRKFGQFCPTQCKKTQCKATCDWLAQQAKLGMEGKAIDAAVEKASENQDHLELDDGTLEKLKRQTQAVSITVKGAEMAKDFSKKNLDEATSRRDQANEAHDKAVSKSAEAFENLKKVRGELNDLRNENLRKNGYALDDARQKHKSAVDHVADLEKQIKTEKDEADTDRKAKHDAGEKHDALLEEATKLKEDGEKMSQKLDEQKDLIAKKKQDMDTMQMRLDKVLANNKEGGYDDMVKSLTEGVAIEKKEWEEEKKQQQNYELALEKLKRGEEHTRKDADEAAKARDAADERVQKHKEASDTLNASMQDAEGAEQEAKAKVTELEAQKADFEENIRTKEESEDKAVKTLEFARAAEKEAKDELDDRTKGQAATSEKDKEKENELRKARASQIDKDDELAAHEEELAKKKEAWEAENAGVTDRVKAHQDAGRALNKLKPDVVRQHGLGLFFQRMVSVAITGSPF